MKKNLTRWKEGSPRLEGLGEETGDMNSTPIFPNAFGTLELQKYIEKVKTNENN